MQNVRRLFEGRWGEPDEQATYPPIRPDSRPLPIGDLGRLAARVDELIHVPFILEEIDSYPPHNTVAWRANWELPTGEVPFLIGEPILVFGLLDYLAGLAEANAGKVIKRPWRNTTATV